MRKLKLLIILLLSSISISAVEAIRPSKAILESNVGEMEVQMNLLDDGSWKLTSLLDGGSIVKREESEVFELIDNQIKPINYRFNQRILFRKYIASADFDWTDKTVSYVENKDSGTLGLDENILGPSSASLQLRLDFRKLTEENIPNEIIVDLDNTEINTSLKISSVTLPDLRSFIIPGSSSFENASFNLSSINDVNLPFWACFWNLDIVEFIKDSLPIESMYFNPVYVNTLSSIYEVAPESVNSWAIFSTPRSFLVIFDFPTADTPTCFKVSKAPPLYAEKARSPI